MLVTPAKYNNWRRLSLFASYSRRPWGHNNWNIIYKYLFILFLVFFVNYADKETRDIDNFINSKFYLHY